MPDDARLKPRKKPRQARSSHMVEMILEAAARILEQDGLAGYNTNRIAEVAGVGIGSLYQYFPNKEALTAALIQRSQDRLGAELEQALALMQGQRLDEAVAALTEVLVAYQLDRPRLAAALDYEEARLPVSDVIEESRARIAMMIAGFLHGQGLRPLVGSLATIVADLMTIGRAITDSTIDGPPVSPEDLHRRLNNAVLGYLDRSTRQLT